MENENEKVENEKAILFKSKITFKNINTIKMENIIFENDGEFSIEM